MKKILAVLLILMILTPTAYADNLAETVEQYNDASEFTGVPKVTQLPIVDGTYLCLETGILLMFIKSETSDDIHLLSCVTLGRPDGESFLRTVCTFIKMVDPLDTIMNYGRVLQSFIIAKNTGAVMVTTSNDCTGQITYKPEQLFILQ